MQLLRTRFGLPVLVVMLLTACAATQLNAVWKDPAYKAHPKKILVIAVAKNPENRKSLEDGFVAHLKARGSSAIASYTLLPEYKQNDQEGIAKLVREQGADALLITRLVGKRNRGSYVPGKFYQPPPNYSTWRDYFGYGMDVEYMPGFMVDSRNSVMEINLYDTVSDQLIWSVSSETGGMGSGRDIIDSYIDVIMKNMSEQGLLGS
mgnify:CR=1 FL=1